MSTDSIIDYTEWNCIECTPEELRIDITLACGQAFRWKLVNGNEWLGVFSGYVWRLAQNESNLFYKVYSRELDTASQPASASSHKQLLINYFRLSTNLQELYADWCSRDSKLVDKLNNLKGVRQLDQDPVETLFSFICSSNNNISRISGMVDRMCQKYGEKITVVDGITFHDFPKVEVLAGEDVEAGLRDLGFGYRAAYIQRSARHIMETQSANYLYELRSQPYEHVKSELMKLHGVGAKVADCVCLMGMDKLEAIPVDTHVWQLVVREYKHGIVSSKSLTDTVYRQIGDFFRQLWGPYAGWAQSVAFTAELKQFQHYVGSCMKTTEKRRTSTKDGRMPRKAPKNVEVSAPENVALITAKKKKSRRT